MEGQRNRWKKFRRFQKVAKLPQVFQKVEQPSRALADGEQEHPSKVEAVIRDDPEALAKFREEMKHQGERTDLATDNFPDNVREVTDGHGNSRAYSIARVQRECDPETVAAVMAGEVSPNAAPMRPGSRNQLRKKFLN